MLPKRLLLRPGLHTQRIRRLRRRYLAALQQMVNLRDRHAGVPVTIAPVWNTAEAESDAGMSGVECRIERRDMSYAHFLRVYDEGWLRQAQQEGTGDRIRVRKPATSSSSWQSTCS